MTFLAAQPFFALSLWLVCILNLDKSRGWNHYGHDTTWHVRPSSLRFLLLKTIPGTTLVFVVDELTLKLKYILTVY